MRADKNMTNFKSSAELKRMARGQLLGRYGTVIWAYFTMQITILAVLNLAAAQASAGLLGTFIYYAIYFIVILFTGIFTVGQNYLYLKIGRNDTCSLIDMWYGFRHFPDKAIIIQFFSYAIPFVFGLPFYFTAVRFFDTKDMFWGIACVVTFLLFIGVSIWLQLLFSQAFYLLIDQPNEKGLDLIKKSMELMKGNMGKLFYVNLSFLGMYLLAGITFGIGMLWVHPYVSMTRANFYMELTKKPEATIDIAV